MGTARRARKRPPTVEQLEDRIILLRLACVDAAAALANTKFADHPMDFAVLKWCGLPRTKIAYDRLQKIARRMYGGNLLVEELYDTYDEAASVLNTLIAEMKHGRRPTAGRPDGDPPDALP